MAGLSLRLLGRYSLTIDERPVSGFSTEKERALLAYLAMHPGRPMRRSHLAGVLWPDQPEERALHSCRQALSTLRRLLGDHTAERPYLLLTRETAALDGSGQTWVDVLAFRQCMTRALEHYSGGASPGRLNIAALQEAVALYAGSLLADVRPAGCQPFDEWLLIEQEHLLRDAARGLALLVGYYEARGEYGRGLAVATRLAELSPCDEEHHRLAMRLAAADGQWTAARTQFQTCQRCLATLLDASPSAETLALLEQIEQRSLPAQPPPAPAVLPAPSNALVGRESELADLAARLADPLCRLVTMTGAGGSGKTRLALEAARQQVGLFRDGVYFVALADQPVDAPLEPAVAAALGFAFSDHGSLAGQLADYLRGRDLLLVLDNLEHLSQASAFVVRVLERAPRVVVLATSRGRLALKEEWVLPLDGLPCPSADASPEAVCRWDAPRLFVARVRQVEPRFVLTEGEATAIARICRQVDGLPLGLELAASLFPGRTCAAIADGIAAGMGALASGLSNTPERHRSMRAVFESSCEQLAEDERRVLAALSVFVGGCDAAAALAVAAAQGCHLEALAGRSLLRVGTNGRLSMHEVTRQFARERLAAARGAEEAVLRQHGQYFARWLADCLPLLAGESEAATLDAIAIEVGNIYAAWTWAVSRREVAVIEQALPALHRFFYDRSLHAEGIRFLDLAIPVAIESGRHGLHGRLLAYQGALSVRLGLLKAAETQLDAAWHILRHHGSDADRTLCLLSRAEMLMHAARYQEAAEVAAAAIDAAGEPGDPWARSSGLRVLGDVRHRTGNPRDALPLLEQALVLARRSGRAQAVATALNSLGDVLCHLGDYDSSLALMTESVQLLRRRHDRWRLALAVNNLGTLYHETGSLAKACDCYEESRAVCHDLGDVAGEAVALSNLGELALARGAHDDAEERFLAALRLAREADEPWAVMCTLDNLGLTRSARGDDAGAIACFAEVLATAQSSNVKPMALRVLVHMAALLLRRGGTEAAVLALRLVAHHEAAERDVQRQAEDLLRQAGAPDGATPDIEIDQAIDLVRQGLAA